MSKISVDGDRNVINSAGEPIGKVDYFGNVRDGFHDRGKIVDHRYIDENGTDFGWTENLSSSSGWEGGVVVVFLAAVVGMFYGMYRGLKWVEEQGKLSTARASRSYGIGSLVFVPLVYYAFKNGYKALQEVKESGDPGNEKIIAIIGITLGYVSIAFYTFQLIVVLIRFIFDQ